MILFINTNVFSDASAANLLVPLKTMEEGEKKFTPDHHTGLKYFFYLLNPIERASLLCLSDTL
jgi:hypothetical protein